MRVLVCGGRDYANYQHVWTALSRLPKSTIIVHGAARGADSLAALAATQLMLQDEPHPADWKQHGRSAGPIRNREMLETGIDLVIAFPGGRGTTNMIEKAAGAGVPVVKIPE